MCVRVRTVACGGLTFNLSFSIFKSGHAIYHQLPTTGKTTNKRPGTGKNTEIPAGSSGLSRFKKGQTPRGISPFLKLTLKRLPDS